MGIGGGIITKKTLFAVLLIFSLSLAGITDVSASDVGTAQIQVINNSTAKENVNTSADNLNKSAELQTTVNSSLKTNKIANNTPQVSTTVDTTKSTSINQTNTTKTVNTSAQKSQAAAGTTKKTTVASTSFTLSQIGDAAARVKTYIETNHVLPNYVTIGATQVKMPAFLKLLTAGLLEINSKITTLVTLKSVNAAATPSESIKNGNIYKADYLDLVKRVDTYINTNGVVPNYASSTLGKLRPESLIYAFSRTFNYYKINNALPNYVTVNAWSTIAKTVSTLPRPVYITSDNINGITTDTNRINAIVNGLKALGLTAINWGLGPNTHYSVLQSSSVPANALVVDIYGGADAGVIYEMGQSYYKKLVGTRKVFCAWIAPYAVDITGLAWLPRAHDDSYSPASFTGLAKPDQYLKNNGYDYIYSGDINAIITAIYKEATTA